MTPRRTRLEALRDRYLAVSLRSRSVRLFRATRSGAIDLTVIQALSPAVFERLVAKLGTEHPIPVPLVDVAPEAPELARVAQDIATLARAARTVEMETGAQELAVGWPLLEGRARNGTWFRGPLFLYPVSIEQTPTGRLRWAVSFDGPPAFNRTLMELIERHEGVRAPPSLFADMDDDGLYRPDDATWVGFHRAMAVAELGSSELPTRLPPLESLQPRSREDRDAFPLRCFRLQHTPVLGRFPRWGSTVVRDYEALLDGELTAARLGLADHLLAIDEEGPDPEPVPSTPVADPAELARWSVLPSDPSQDRVLRFVRSTEGAGLVVEGPPGTGKSQLITNLVAQEIARGRRVLVVCQKRSALDVVAQRLTHLGIGEALAVVHDVERDRARVLDEVARRIAPLQTVAEASSGSSWSTDASTFQQLSARLRLSQDAHRALTRSREGQPPLVALQERALGRTSAASPVAEGVETVSEAEAHAIVQSASLLSERVPPVVEALADRRRWHGVPDGAHLQLVEALQTLQSQSRELAALQPHLSPADCQSHAALWEASAPLLDLVQAGGAPENTLRYFWLWTDGDRAHGEWRRVMRRLEQAAATLTPCPPGLLAQPRQEVEALLDHLHTYEELAPSLARFLIPRWWRARSALNELKSRHPSERWPLETGAEAVELVQVTLAWMDLIDDLPMDMPFMEVGLAGDPADIQRTIVGLQHHHDLVEAVHRLHDALHPLGPPFDQWPDMRLRERPLRDAPLLRAALHGRETLRLLRATQGPLFTLADWLSPPALRVLRRELELGELDAVDGRIERMLAASGELEAMVRFDRLAQELPDWAWSLLTAQGPDTSQSAARRMWSSVERAWQASHLRGRDPKLLEAPLTSPHALADLGLLLDEVRRSAGAAVQLAHATHLRDHPGKALGKLSVDAQKKRHRLTLRQLVERYWHRGLAALTPAWFCSPDAVSALFPLEPGLFDLVIFDEASQCPVESALPALVRGRSAVIAGDEQQMPPSHFFRSSFGQEDSEEEEALLATESVLALARVVFPNTLLRWHYRSAHEELIAFSNAAFYQRELATAPPVDQPGFEALRFTEVPGIWKGQTNLIEAESVARGVLETLDQADPPSVGVIAFNRKQAQAIEAALDSIASAEERARALLRREQRRPMVERLFVRNLENVQGDERDVILLSVGYGPASPGGRTHARFGPVSQEGGEKRLNVAITRARQRMHIFASFHPDALDVSRARHVGPRLLKLYLRFARAPQQRAAILDEVLRLGEGRSLGPLRRSRRSPWGQEVLDELRLALTAHPGLSVDHDVGLGSASLDLVIRHGSGPPTGIDCRSFWAETDPLARDVYALRFWERLGWRVIRLTPHQWDTEGLDGLLARLETGAAATPLH